MAASAELFVLEAGRTHALVTPQGVVAGGSPTDMCTQALVFIYTLVPLVVLEVALGAAAPIASDDVLAAMLAAVVTLTLVHIFTAGTTLIEGESPLAFTGEASWCILANALGPTQVDLRSAFIVINAGSVVLGEPRRAFACEAADGVNTQELTVMLLGCTLVKIFAAPSVLLQNIALGAGTLVTPFCVFAYEIAGFGSLVALIQIYTGSPCYVRSVASFTDAVIRSSVIDTLPVSANIVDYLALINICSVGHESSAVGTQFLVSHCALEGADLTVGSPASPSITAALGLGDGVPVARSNLAHVLQHLGKAVPFPVVQALILSGAGCEAIITLTGVAPQGVEATPILTDPRLGLTLILIYAALSIRSALVPRAADAHVGTDEVLALHLLFSTVVFPLCTLILIFTHPPVFSQNVSNRALAFIGPIGIYTAEGAEQRILGTFIYIFTCHHWTRLESLLTGTFKTSNNILAGPVSTRIAHGAFISIHTLIPFQNITKGTLAAIGAVCVDALPMFTDIRFFAFIHINCRVIRAHDDPTSKGADLSESLIWLSGTQLTRVSPAFSLQSAAAFLLGMIPGFGR